VARKKGDKDYTKSEKQLLISLINDYSLFGAHDHEIIQMISKKIGKKISETLFYRLKKEAKEKRGEAEEWLDYYSKYQFIEFYRKRIEELEYVQRSLLKILAEETEKEEQDKTIINQLSKTIAEISKVLADFGMAPPIIFKILNLVTMNYGSKKNQENEELRKIRLLHQNVKSGIYLPLDNEPDIKSESIEYDDPNRVF
jgi:hypothetical protein